MFSSIVVAICHDPKLDPAVMKFELCTFLVIFIGLSMTQTQDAIYKPNCEPPYAEVQNFMTVLKTIQDYGSTKWDGVKPGPEDLPKIIEFWCLKP